MKKLDSQILYNVNMRNYVFLEVSDIQQRRLQSIKVIFYYDTGEIEFDSLINPPRNREDGYPRVGRYVADPAAREKIEEVVRK
ncbi:MAG: hypothetical protein ACLUJC_03050 [Clostridia bacterium]